MKKTDKDFELFKSEFKKWQQKFGLTGYKVYFKHEPVTNGFASIVVDQSQMVATATLNSDDKKNPDKHIKISAKHEAIHLLLYKLEYCGVSRYVQSEGIYEAVEELVFKLEDLINA